MTRTRSVSLALFMIFTTPAMAADQGDFEPVLRATYYDLQRDAAAAYSTKNYGKAFEKFHRLACAGDKTSQAALGEMYFKGLGVQRNDLTAYEWFKLAAEYNFAAYRKISKAIEEQLSPSQAQFTTPRVAQLMSNYGLRATNMSCELGPSTWSASNMKDQIQCTPDSVNGGTQVLLHRCKDDEATAR